MLANYSTKQKTIILLVAGLIIIGCIFLFATMIRFVAKQFAPQPTPTPPLEITYCGAKPEAICILSFGRDGSGDTLINLFVASTDFPDFYLSIKKLSGEVLYTCEKNEDVETSVYCAGEAILLGEQVEVTVLSKESDLQLATGKFVVTAILVSPPIQDSNPLPLTATPDSLIPETATTPASYP